MKWIYLIVSLSFIFISCEDVIEVDVPSEEPRLIIDALIRVDTTELFTNVVVKVSQTNSFFESIPAAELQQITLTNLDFGGGPVPPVLIEEEPGSGIYSKIFPNSFLTKGRILIQIDFEDRYYVAYAEFAPSVPIDNLVQGDGTLFGENDTEIILSYTDLPERDDFYLFDFDLNNYLVSEDKFYQGQAFEFSYFYEEDEVSPGDEVTISIMGSDESFFNYMALLIEQSEQGFGPFETPALTVRGNFINATDIDNINIFDNVDLSDNFALGYFAIVQEYKQSLIIE